MRLHDQLTSAEFKGRPSVRKKRGLAPRRLGASPRFFRTLILASADLHQGICRRCPGALGGDLSPFVFSPSLPFAAGRLGTRLGSYFDPADTCTMVMRILVGKNFSKSARLWAWPLPPLLSFMTRSICLIPWDQTMESFCQNDVIFTSCS